MINKAEFTEIAAGYGFELSQTMLDRFDEYARILVEWNEKMNLTAITEPADIVNKHFLDSLLFFKAFEPQNGAKLIDVGTGAGFPSIPIKIFRNDLNITLLDSLNKRVNFLNEALKAVSLDGECIHGRAEELARNSGYREQFDVACARAVAKLPVLCEYCLPYVKRGGVFAALKGSEAALEAAAAENAIRVLGGKISEIKELTLPDGDKRGIIIIKKISQTPTKYPRQSAKIAKKPL